MGNATDLRELAHRAGRAVEPKIELESENCKKGDMSVKRGARDERFIMLRIECLRSAVRSSRQRSNFLFLGTRGEIIM